MLNELKLKYPDFDENIARYRLWEIYEAVKIVEGLTKGDANLDYVTGALYMLKKILHLPLKWGTTDTSKEIANNMVKRDVKEFTAKYMRIFLE